MVLSGISKSYAGVAALTDVSLEVLPGEVHALLGENGAGKSTLMGVASGTIEPDAGVAHAGRRAASTTLTPAAATALGHRDRPPAPGRAARPDGRGEPPARGACRRAHLRRPVRARRHARRARRRRSARRTSRSGSTGSQSRRSTCSSWPRRSRCARACSSSTSRPRRSARTRSTCSSTGCGPSPSRARPSSTSPTASPRCAMLAERVTVLRDGRLRGSTLVDDVTDDELLALIVGRQLESTFPPKPADDTFGDTDPRRWRACRARGSPTCRSPAAAARSSASAASSATARATCCARSPDSRRFDGRGRGRVAPTHPAPAPQGLGLHAGRPAP